MGDGLGLKEFRARIRVSLSLVVILGSRIILFMELLLVFRDSVSDCIVTGKQIGRAHV